MENDESVTLELENLTNEELKNVITQYVNQLIKNAENRVISGLIMEDGLNG